MLSSPAFLLVLSTITLLIGVATTVIALQKYSLRKQCESHLLHIASHQAEFVLLVESQRQLLEAQKLLEGSIDGTTATVRALHRLIASIPFGILEAIPVTRRVTKIVHSVHDLISDVVYSSISITNKTSGKVIRKGLEKTSVDSRVEKRLESSQEDDLESSLESNLENRLENDSIKKLN